MFWAGGLSLFTPLPYLNDETFKGHVFANAGHLIGIDRGAFLDSPFIRNRSHKKYSPLIGRPSHPTHSLPKSLSWVWTHCQFFLSPGGM